MEGYAHEALRPTKAHLIGWLMLASEGCDNINLKQHCIVTKLTQDMHGDKFGSYPKV